MNKESWKIGFLYVCNFLPNLLDFWFYQKMMNSDKNFEYIATVYKNLFLRCQKLFFFPLDTTIFKCRLQQTVWPIMNLVLQLFMVAAHFSLNLIETSSLLSEKSTWILQVMGIEINGSSYLKQNLLNWLKCYVFFFLFFFFFLILTNIKYNLKLISI